MSTARVSSSAKQDLRSIFLYTEEQFGSAAALSLHARLWKAFAAHVDVTPAFSAPEGFH